MRLATPLLATVWLCAAFAVVALPLTALAAEPVEVEVEVTPSTQPADVAGDTDAERDAAYVPPKVTVKQRIAPPSDEDVAKWRDFVLAILGALVVVLGFIAVMVVPAFLKVRDAVTAQGAKTAAQDHRIDRLGDNVNQVMRDLPPTPKQ